MKKAFPYIVGALVFIALLALIFSMRKGERKLNERMSFSRKDKIPYGTYVAYENLKYIFPGAPVNTNRLSPQKWFPDLSTETHQVLFIIAPVFLADESEMDKVIAFAQKGNTVFISTRILSYEAQEMLHCRTPYNEFAFFGNTASGLDDTLSISLAKPPFAGNNSYTFPGKRFESHFYKYDTTHASVLGSNVDQYKDFIELKTGRGTIFLHLAPVAFTNYFLLHRENADFYNKVLSIIPKDVSKITWDEYYLHKLFESNNNQSKGWLYVLLKYPPFKWGLLVAIVALTVFILSESRRKQRYVPYIAKPKNDSLDFVKTIGRLYYEKNDHLDLARKMGLYFLEHVRNTYKLSTNTLDDAFVNNLHFKSGYDADALKKIVSLISFTETAPGVSESQLADFHKQLEEFYKHT
ncbi:MAG: DUF4350 domain-containing protein [Chitinophagaceae bacterium]